MLNNSRYRRYFSRLYLYPLFFIFLFILLMWWNSLPEDDELEFGYENEQIIKDSGKFGPPLAKPLPEEPSKKLNVVRLTVYMEAQCPDTTGFIRRQLVPSWSRLGSTNRLHVSIVPFGKASCTQENNDYKCDCQHGPNECELNQLMNCVIDLFPDPDSFIPLIGCIQGKDSLVSAFKSCLPGHSSSDWLWKCAVGEKGRKLHAASGNKTAALGDDFNFVPWVVINGARENDAFYALEENLCKRIEGPKPRQCSKFS